MINWNDKSNLIVCYSARENGSYREYTVDDIYDDGDDRGGRYRVNFKGMHLWFHENAECNIGRSVAYIKQKEADVSVNLLTLPADQLEVVAHPSKSYAGVYPVESVGEVTVTGAAYVKFIINDPKDGFIDYGLFFDPDGLWNVRTDEYVLRRKANTVEPSKVDNGLIDWSKPIQYVDGSPATYLGTRGPGSYAVTPKGRPNDTSGNHYNSKGKHIYNAFADVVNVPEQGATLNTLLGEARRNKKGLEFNLRKWVNEGRIVIK